MRRIQRTLNQGLQALNSGQLVIAEQKFDAVLAECADEPNALFLLGAVRKGQGRLVESEQLMRRALPGHPEPADVLNSLGNLMDKMQQPERAVEFYLQAIEKRPQFVKGYFNLGLSLNKLGRHAEAVAALKRLPGKHPGMRISGRRLAAR